MQNRKMFISKGLSNGISNGTSKGLSNPGKQDIQEQQTNIGEGEMSLLDWASIGRALKIDRVLANQEKIMTRIIELAGLISGVQSQLDKAKNEIVGKIGDLETALSDVELSPEASAALDSLKSSAQALDDIVPDHQPVEPPAEPVPTEPAEPTTDGSA